MKSLKLSVQINVVSHLGYIIASSQNIKANLKILISIIKNHRDRIKQHGPLW
jgi:hypothetical protein